MGLHDEGENEVLQDDVKRRLGEEVEGENEE
jgi:hypothetical protein